MSRPVRDIIVFLGPPGSGKGSISNLCIKELGWVSVSAGNLCRKHVAEQTQIGREIDFAIKSGKLIGDGLVTGMIAEWLDHMRDSHSTVILDGFPRTVGQAKALQDLLDSQCDSVRLKIVRFRAPHEVIVDRLSNRLVCQNRDCQMVYSFSGDAKLRPRQQDLCDECGNVVGRRKDDEYEAVCERLRVYSKHEQELIGFYNQLGHVVSEVHVAQPLHNVFDDFKRVLGLLHND